MEVLLLITAADQVPKTLATAEMLWVSEKRPAIQLITGAHSYVGHL